MAPGGLILRSKKNNSKNIQKSSSLGQSPERMSSHSSNPLTLKGFFARSNQTSTQGTTNPPNHVSLERASSISNLILNNGQHVSSEQSPIDVISNQVAESAEIPSGELSSISAFASKKRGRGQTLGKGLMKSNVASGSKMKVNVDPSIGRPINGEQSAKLASTIGMVTRDVLPVPIKWRDVDVDNDLQPSFDHINIYMDVNMDELGVKNSLIERLKNSSRQERFRLHAKFKKYSSVEEAKKNKPKNIEVQDHWDALCDHFANPKYQKTCATNAANRSKVKAPHISGRKPFIIRRQEISQKELNGEPCDRIELYKRTHFSEKNGWSSQAAEENWKLMLEKVEQYNQQGISKTIDEIVQEVLGLGSGYIKGLGYGPKPPSRRSSSIDLATQKLQKDLSEAQEKLNVSESEVKELKTQMDVHETMVTDLKSQLSQQGKTIEKLLSIMIANGMPVD